jgi:hypothetical protein
MPSDIFTHKIMEIKSDITDYKSVFHIFALFSSFTKHVDNIIMEKRLPSKGYF